MAPSCSSIFCGVSLLLLWFCIKNTNLPTLRTKNTTKIHLNKGNKKLAEFNKSSVYPSTCSDCHMKYVGQKEENLWFNSRNIYKPPKPINKAHNTPNKIYTWAIHSKQQTIH
jgi:hypothetical protein